MGSRAPNVKLFIFPPQADRGGRRAGGHGQEAGDQDGRGGGQAQGPAAHQVSLGKNLFQFRKVFLKVENFKGGGKWSFLLYYKTPYS